MMSHRGNSNPTTPDDDLVGLLAEIEAAATASEERLKALACQLPGGDLKNYIVVLCDFLASEYHWG